MMLSDEEKSVLAEDTSTYKDDGKYVLPEVFWYHQL